MTFGLSIIGNYIEVCVVVHYFQKVKSNVDNDISLTKDNKELSFRKLLSKFEL